MPLLPVQPQPKRPRLLSVQMYLVEVSKGERRHRIGIERVLKLENGQDPAEGSVVVLITL